MKHSEKSLSVSPNLLSRITKISVKKLSILSLSATFSIAVIGCSESQKEQATESLGLDEKDVFSLKVGSCFNNPSDANIEEDELVTDVPIRECNKPHDNEVFHIFNLTGMTDQRDAKAIEEQVYTQCDAAYSAFIGKPYEDSSYDMSYLAPSDESWENGDREVTCYVFNPESEQMTASLQGSKV